MKATGLIPDPVAESSPPIPTVAPGPAPALYLSRRLDWFTVSAGSVQLYASVVLIDSPASSTPAPYYRITPHTLAWFEASLLRLNDNPKAPLAEKTEAARVWRDVVIPFAEEWVPIDEVKSARAAGGSLPPVPEVPMALPTTTAIPKRFAPMRLTG